MVNPTESFETNPIAPSTSAQELHPNPESLPTESAAESSSEASPEATDAIVNEQSLTLPWVTAAAITDIGKVRERNEDRYLLAAWPDESALLAVVADGMGGSRGGAVAAQIAVDTFRALLDQPLPRDDKARFDALLACFYEADRHIREQGNQSFEFWGMGTTVLAAIITPTDYLHLYAGDCRIYHLRPGDRGTELVRRSHDHSIVELLLEVGRIADEADIANHPMRGVVNSCLGGRSADGNFSVDPKWNEDEHPIFPLEKHDLLLLCSDGLHGAVLTQPLLDYVQANPDPATLTPMLRQAALDNGGKDNITLITIQVKPNHES